MTTAIHTETAPATILLDDLLLDAQHELELAELPALGHAVAEARVTLIRHSILHGDPPPRVATLDPETLAPPPVNREPPSMPLVEEVARCFHARYEELAQALGYRTRRETARPWDELPPVNRQLMIATAAAVLQELGIRPGTES